MAIVNTETGARTWEGCVLTTRERNFYDDSDFYALVWDGTAIITVEYGTTRFHSPFYAYADATEPVKRAASAWLEEVAYDELVKQAEWGAMKVERGVDVRIVDTWELQKKYRHFIGETGDVFWVGKDRWRRGERVGVWLRTGKKLFVPADAVERITPAPIDYDLLRARARYYANPEHTTWRTFVALPHSGIAVA